MDASTVVLVAAIAVAIVLAMLSGGKLPAPFGARSCQGGSWHRSFPEASKEEIRRFLSTFTESFAFDNREKLKLNPNDQLLDIYRALYPHRWQADALELETLSDDLHSKYGVTLSSVWREGLTFGQLFQHVLRATK